MFIIHLAFISQFNFLIFFFLASVHKWNFLRGEDFLDSNIVYHSPNLKKKTNQKRSWTALLQLIFKTSSSREQIFIALSSWPNVIETSASISKHGLENEKQNCSKKDHILQEVKPKYFL